jgi:anti-anti-sigma factor
MTTANVATRRGNGTFDCAGAQIRAYCHHLATVVTIRGVIDGANVEWVGAYLLRFILGGDPVVLDLSDVNHFAAAGISLLKGFDEECRVAGVDWTLVAGPAISELLDDGRDEDVFPMARSVREALQNLADAIASRRQLVLPLIRKTA